MVIQKYWAVKKKKLPNMEIPQKTLQNIYKLRKLYQSHIFEEGIENRFAIEANFQINICNRRGLVLFWSEHSFRFFDSISVDKFIEIDTKMPINKRRKVSWGNFKWLGEFI